MSLWEMPAAKLFSTLEELQAANVPSDPWNELLYREFLKQKPTYQQIMDVDRLTYADALKAQQWCLTTLVELRTLQRDTPLRYREFARMFDDPGSRTPGSAIAFMKDKAASGDSDAGYAILRAAVECPPEKLAPLSQAVLDIGLERQGVLRFLGLYRPSLDFSERIRHIEKLFPAPPAVEEPLALPAPPVSAFSPPYPEAGPPPQTAPPPARTAPPRPQSRVSQMQGPGYLAVLRPDGQIEGLKVEAERISQMPAGYSYSTEGRRILSSQISDCLNLVALYCEDESVDLLERTSGLMLARLPKGFTAFTRAPDGSLLLGGSFGLYIARNGSEAEPLAKHQIQALCGAVRVLAEGEMWVGNQPRFEVDRSRRLRISPDGNWLAQWNAAGDVEIYEVATGRSRAYFATRLEDLDLSFSLDSKRLLTTSPAGMMVWSLSGQPQPDLCPPKLVSAAG